MEPIKLAVTFAICLVTATIVTAKSESASAQNVPSKPTQTHNSLPAPSTQKPHELQYHQQQQQRQYHHPSGGLHQIAAPQLSQHNVHSVQLHAQMTQLQPVGMPQLHPQTQQQILQFIQRALYTSQMNNQPAAMIIIAQPPVVAPAGVFANVDQRPVEFFRNYQPAVVRPSFARMLPIPSYVRPIYPQPQPQPQPLFHSRPPTQPQLQPQLQPEPQPEHLPQPQPLTYRPYQAPLPATTRMLPYQAKPQNYDHLATLAQEVAEKHSDSPMSSLPPIITGFENFSPEQQAKIKEQLSKHFGAPLMPLQKDQKYQTLSTRLSELIPKGANDRQEFEKM